MEHRAAVFTSHPQDVEVYSGGAWLPGSMLGWRHDTTGGCQVQVRLTHGDDEIWTDLERLRLPERHLAIAPEPGAGPVGSAAGGADAPERTITRGLTAIRGMAPPSGRAAHPAGRRRAPETAESPAVIVGLSAVASGRHRAPASGMTGDAGRHRAADTGVWPVVTDLAATAELPRGWVDARADDTWSGPRRESGATGPVVDEPADLLTRPMRLADAVPRPRTGRLDGSPGGC
jgi:hypothetical protein